MRWPPACEDVSPGAEEYPLLKDVTEQRSEDRDWEHQTLTDSGLLIAVMNCELNCPVNPITIQTPSIVTLKSRDSMDPRDGLYR
jgi:hypothetical protein